VVTVTRYMQTAEIRTAAYKLALSAQLKHQSITGANVCLTPRNGLQTVCGKGLQCAMSGSAKAFSSTTNPDYIIAAAERVHVAGDDAYTNHA
jgi:hypothetical protein